MWLGDVAYIDKPDFSFEPMDYEYKVQRFQATKNAPGYSKFKRVIGVWDDHDFGSDDAGSELQDKHVNRELFLDFIGEPLDS